MSVAELHPEDLIDKEMLGELSVDERVRLDAHLASCAPCRFEREARDDFRHEFEAEARRPRAEVSLAPALPLPAARPPMPRWVRVAVLIAAAFVAASAGAAVLSTMGHRFSALSSRTEGEQETLRAAAAHGHVGSEGSRAILAGGAGAEIAAAAESASAAATALEAAAASATEAATASGTATAAEPATAARVEIAAPIHDRGAPALPAREVGHVPTATTGAGVALGSAPVDVPLAAVPAPAAPPSLSVDVETPAASFSSASAALRRGDYATATALFEGLQEKFPGSTEARTSYAILGRLALDRGDAGGALRAFDLYLRGGGGALTEEVLVGRAQALERLGRTSDESAAWAALLTAFPRTSHAEHARSRLDAIGAR